MNSNKFVYSVIAVLISVVFIGSCLAPVVMDAVTGDKQTITLSNDDTGATTFVYKLAAADSIVGNINTGEYTITAGGTDYTTMTDPLLINPDEGIIAPDIQNGKIVVYSSEGVAENYPIANITKIVDSGYTTWLLTSDGKAYGCGWDNKKQQGDNSTTDVGVFTDRTPEGKTVTDIVATSNTTWLLTSDGKAYGCGGNTYKQQGDNSTTDVGVFTDRTPEGKIVSAIFAYSNITWLLTSDGKAFVCGDNQYYKQGHGSSGYGVFTDVTPSGKTITEITTNGNTTWLLTSDGKAYGCGRNNYMQQGAGQGVTTDVNSFTDRTPEGKTITKISASSDTTWLLTSDGKAYGCGSNSSMQQGAGQGVTTNVGVFTDRTPEGKTVTAIPSSGYTTTWLLTSDGKAYGCGENENMQQGAGQGVTTDVGVFTEREIAGFLLQIEDKADYYLITDAADIPNQYLYITDASTGYYADPSEAIVFGTAASSYFVSVGATAGSHYGTLPTLATVNGTNTQLSPGYHVYQYSDSFPVTADGVSTGLAGFVELEYQGEVGQGGLDPTFGTLLVLTVTFAIIGVVLAAVRMIGGRE